MKIWLKDLIWRFTLTLAHGILINQFHKIGLLQSCTDTNPTDSSPEHWSAMGAAQTKTTWPDSINPFWWVMDRMENLCQKKCEWYFIMAALVTNLKHQSQRSTGKEGKCASGEQFILPCSSSVYTEEVTVPLLQRLGAACIVISPGCVSAQGLWSDN